MSKVIRLLVSASGFSPKKIKAFKGDTIELKPSGKKPPTSVLVITDWSTDSGALFGIPYPVPSRQKIQVVYGDFRIRAGRYSAIVAVEEEKKDDDAPEPDDTDDLMEPKPTPNPRNVRRKRSSEK
jgi:hypothetical protein